MDNKTEVVLKATYEGVLIVGENQKLPCAVLEDGTRLLTMTAVYKALGRSIRSKISVGNRVISMPSFMDAQNLQAYVSEELKGVINPVAYRTIKGSIREGFNAKILPLVCDVYLAARQAGALTKKQEPVAMQAEILVRSLSKVGIIALVDEATGYQYSRERDELQKILRAYIAEELLPWQKTFPDVFYQEIFRLNGWDFTIGDIKKRPGVIGTWTNKLIYEQLPKGVLDELRKKTPKSDAGNYTARLFQSLTMDSGNPHLQNQINSVITLMQISDHWKNFEAQFDKLVSRRMGQIELNFGTKKPAKPASTFDQTLKGVLSVPPPNEDADQHSKEEIGKGSMK